MTDRPFGVPDSYDTCPVCKTEFRKCEHSWKQADKAYLSTHQNKAKAGKTNGDIVKAVVVDGINLYLWKDGRVTWGK